MQFILTIFGIIVTTFVLIVTLVWFILYLWVFLIPRFKREWLLLRIGARPWAKMCSYMLFGPSLKIKGEENIPEDHKGFIIISNHLSFIDIPVFVSTLGYSFVLKSSLMYNPVGWGAYLSGGIPVERSNHKSRKKVIRDVIRMCKESVAVHLFPEGTRSRTGELQPFKKGLLYQLYEEKIPVLCCGIWGTQNIIPADKILMKRNQNIGLCIGRLLQPRDFESFNSFFAACRAEVENSTAEAKTMI